MGPDPVDALYPFSNVSDREIAGLVASCLSYGNVTSIVEGVRRAVAFLGPSPADFLQHTEERQIFATTRGFRYRVTNGRKLGTLLVAMKRVLRDHGSLERLLRSAVLPTDETILPGIQRLVDAILERSEGPLTHLLPDPSRGSACKRLCLFARWMVRHDEIDPGGWTLLNPMQLIVPLDVHVHRLARGLKWTTRQQPSLRAALEVTRVLRQICPLDPLRYDFAMVRAIVSGLFPWRGVAHPRKD